MKENPPKHKWRKETGKGSDSVIRDLMTTCPRCGGEMSLWSGASETVCIFCKYRVFERENTTH
jgi:DNA-directed RNA polymerase subunit RPC12/RpoP